jgi:hypothetical protein
MKTIVNCETNEVTNRELNAEELKQQKIDDAATAKQLKLEAEEASAKAEAKAKLLARLGITAEEAQLLLS